MNKREFIYGGLAAASTFKAAAAQTPGKQVASGAHKDIKRSKAKTTPLFKSPGLYPNALAVAPEGLWIGQQKISVAQAQQWNEPVPSNRDEAAWLVDWNGKLLKTISTKSRNTSGMAYGNGCVWMGANTDPDGIYQTDMHSNTVNHRQIPLGVGPDGGGCHGAQWHDAKLWIVANRPRLLLRIDPVSWKPEAAIPIYATPDKPRWHDMTFDAQGNIWQINGNDSRSPAEGRPGLIKYAPTGEVLELVDFVAGSCDPHGLEFHNGALISCDAGVHPGWDDHASPYSGMIFKIDMI